jgi:hypothetical protein
MFSVQPLELLFFSSYNSITQYAPKRSLFSVLSSLYIYAFMYWSSGAVVRLCMYTFMQLDTCIYAYLCAFVCIYAVIQLSICPLVHLSICLLILLSMYRFISFNPSSEDPSQKSLVR